MSRGIMKQSFTLIELIVVIAIIAILAAVIAPDTFRAVEKAKVAKGAADIKTIKTAVMAYYADNGRFPCSNVGGWCNDPGFMAPITAVTCESADLWDHHGGTQTCATCIDGPAWDGPYLDRWPARNPWENAYVPWYPYKGYSWNHISWWLPGGTACFPATFIALQNSAHKASYDSLKKIDTVLDDGDLTTGNLFSEPQFPGEPPVDPLKPSYIMYLIECQE